MFAQLHYKNASEFQATQQKNLLFFGMSGLGKTHFANALRDTGDWFHYSIDYRIGTAYMGEAIADDLKLKAMEQPYLAQLLKSDSVYIGSNITFDNLAPLSCFMGKPGNPDKGGLPFSEYQRRQALHKRAEINALLDTPDFIDRAQKIYGYDHFVCDTGGSICEVVDPNDPEDEILKTLSASNLMIWLEGSQDHIETLVNRFKKAPKPLFFLPDFLQSTWSDYLQSHDLREEDVDPDAFMIWIYEKAIRQRHPRYKAMAQNWGVTLHQDVAKTCRDAQDILGAVAQALGKPD